MLSRWHFRPGKRDYELGINTGCCGVDSKTSTERGERNGGADLPESPWRLTLICETQTAK
jgi:hypothetical protein